MGNACGPIGASRQHRTGRVQRVPSRGKRLPSGWREPLARRTCGRIATLVCLVVLGGGCSFVRGTGGRSEAPPSTPASPAPASAEAGSASQPTAHAGGAAASTTAATSETPAPATATAAPQPAAAPLPPRKWRFEATLRYWAPSLHGRFFSAEGGSAGTVANFSSDLGLPENKSFFYPIVTAYLGERHRVTFSYLNMRYTADTTVSRAIDLQGKGFTVGAPLHSEAKLKELAMTYDYLAWKREKWMGFIGGQLRYFDAAVKLNSTGVTVNEQGKIPIPTIGGGGEYKWRDWATVKGEYRVFALPAGDIRGSLQDGQVGVTIDLLGMVGREPRILCSIFSSLDCLRLDPSSLEGWSLSAGLRYFRILAKDGNTTSIDWLQKGPTFDLTYRF